jgi:hypothetical protein
VAGWLFGLAGLSTDSPDGFYIRSGGFRIMFFRAAVGCDGRPDYFLPFTAADKGVGAVCRCVISRRYGRIAAMPACGVTRAATLRSRMDIRRRLHRYACCVESVLLLGRRLCFAGKDRYRCKAACRKRI